jgi:hypothetical protein
MKSVELQKHYGKFTYSYRSHSFLFPPDERILTHLLNLFACCVVFVVLIAVPHSEQCISA